MRIGLRRFCFSRRSGGCRVKGASAHEAFRYGLRYALCGTLHPGITERQRIRTREQAISIVLAAPV